MDSFFKTANKLQINSTGGTKPKTEGPLDMLDSYGCLTSVRSFFVAEKGTFAGCKSSS